MSEYADLINVGVNSLEENEFWCVFDPGGLPMPETKSKRFDVPVIMFCDALNCDWADAKDMGYYLGKYAPTVEAKSEVGG